MIIALAVFAFTGPAAAQHAKGTGIHVEAAWARASMGAGRPGAVFFTLVNGGKTADRLLGAETGVARTSQFHSHVMDGNIMLMRATDALEVPAGTKLVLRPGGKHLMLMGLKRELKAGDSFKVTLRLEQAGSMEITVAVQKLGAMGPGRPGGHGSRKH